MGVDLAARLMYGVDITRGQPSFLQRVEQGEFGPFEPHDAHIPWSGIEEHLLDRLEGIDVIEAVDHYDGASVGAVAGVVLATCHNRDDQVSNGLSHDELRRGIDAAQNMLARHGLGRGDLWLISYAG